MKLLVDVGNSCIKWACFTQDTLSTQQRVAYRCQHLADLLENHWKNLDPPSQVWIATVAGAESEKILTQWIQMRWQITPIFVQTARQFGEVINGYNNYAQLGVDRWIALLGARSLEWDNVCIVDCGTAITIDVLAATGQHQGGLILPGIDLMHHALLRETYALSELTKQSTKKSALTLLAHDTLSGIQVGTLYAVISLIEYVMASLEHEDEKTNLILTGGGVTALLPFLQRPYQHVPDLVLRGLVVMVSERL